MNQIQKKILLVFLMTVTVIGGYIVFMVKNVEYWRSQPEYITYNGTGHEVLSDINLRNSNSSNNKNGYKSGADKDLAAEANGAASNLMPGSNGSIASGVGNTVSGRYNYGQYRKDKTSEGMVSTSGGQAFGLLAAGGRKGQNTSSGVGGVVSAPLTETTMDVGVPSVLQLAKGGNGKGGGGGGPGGDPYVPVGDGLWILMLLASGYMFYIRRK